MKSRILDAVMVGSVFVMLTAFLLGGCTPADAQIFRRRGQPRHHHQKQIVEVVDDTRTVNISTFTRKVAPSIPPVPWHLYIAPTRVSP